MQPILRTPNYFSMTSRSYILLFLAMMLSLCASANDNVSALIPVPTPTPNEAEELAAIQALPRSKMYDAFNLLSQKKRIRFAELLRNFNPELTYDQISAHRVEEVNIDWPSLIALGDPITCSYLANEMLRDPYAYRSGPWDILWRWRSAQIVKELGPTLERNDPIWGRKLEPSDTDNATRAMAFSSQFAEYILDVVGKPPIFMGNIRSTAPYFPELAPATKASLKAFYLEWKEARKEIARNYKGVTNDLWEDALTESYVAKRHTMRAWWIANKESFLAEKYDEVKPLDEATTIHPTKAVQMTPGKATLTPSTPKSVFGPLVPEPAQKPSGNYAIFAVVAAFVAAIILLLRNRLTRKK